MVRKSVAVTNLFECVCPSGHRGGSTSKPKARSPGLMVIQTLLKAATFNSRCGHLEKFL